MELEVGAIVEGKVTSITKFGAFVALPGGRNGLVHISEIAYSYVAQVSDFLKEGQEVKVKVIGIDENNRINLSIKKATEPPPRQEQRERRPRQDYAQGGNRFNNDGAPRERAPRPAGGAPRNNFAPKNAAPKEPASFEDKLKQFMQSSDAKMSELKYLEKKGGNRRGGGRR